MNQQAKGGLAARRSGRLRLGVGLTVGTLLAVGVAGLYGARRRADAALDALEGLLLREGLDGVFSEALVADLPEPAQRFLRYAIAPGTPLARVGRFELRGRLRRGFGGPWEPFRARETLAPPRGYVWRSRAGGWPQAIGHDTLVDGRARRAWYAWGLLPTADHAGPDQARSAAGRLALAALWVPATLLPSAGATWEAIDDDTAEVTVPIGDVAPRLRITVDPDGRVVRATVMRWRLDDGEARQEPYGFDRVIAEGTFHGYRVPTHVVVGWLPASGRAFLSYEPRVVRVLYG